jgi:hypothetical protein
MRKAMKCPDLTITDNRHGVGSRQVVLRSRQNEKTVCGKLGLGHTQPTQDSHYDDYGDHQSVRNVALANEAYYNKETQGASEEDPEMIEWQRKE